MFTSYFIFQEACSFDISTVAQSEGSLVIQRVWLTWESANVWYVAVRLSVTCRGFFFFCDFSLLLLYSWRTTPKSRNVGARNPPTHSETRGFSGISLQTAGSPLFLSRAVCFCGWQTPLLMPFGEKFDRLFSMFHCL